MSGDPGNKKEDPFPLEERRRAGLLGTKTIATEEETPKNDSLRE